MCWEQDYADGAGAGNGWVVGSLRPGRMMYQASARDRANMGRTMNDTLSPPFAQHNATMLACR